MVIKCVFKHIDFSDLDEKYRKRSDRYSSGIITDFREKEGYKPDIKLEYVDDSGRSLNAKEAFRQLSHRFHGKGSGKRKTEKRYKKLEEEQVSIQNFISYQLPVDEFLVVLTKYC